MVVGAESTTFTSTWNIPRPLATLALINYQPSGDARKRHFYCLNEIQMEYRYSELHETDSNEISHQEKWFGDSIQNKDLGTFKLKAIDL